MLEILDPLGLLDLDPEPKGHAGLEGPVGPQGDPCPDEIGPHVEGQTTGIPFASIMNSYSKYHPHCATVDS